MMNRLKNIGYLLLIPCVLGCGRAPEQAPLTKDRAATGSSTQGQAASTTEEKATNVASPSTAEVASDAAIESTATASALDRNAVAAKPEVANSKEAVQEKTVVSDTPPQLTEEQKKRWAWEAVEPMQLLAVRESSKLGFLNCMAVVPDGKSLIVAGTKVMSWPIQAAEPDRLYFESNGSKSDFVFKSLAIAPNGKWFAAGDSEGMLRLWSLEDHKEMTAKKVHNTGILQIAISPDSSELATITYGDEVLVWSAPNLQPKGKFKVNTRGVERLLYLKEGELVAAGESTSSWDVATGKLIRQLSPGRYNFVLARTNDGARFLFGGDKGLQFWNVKESKLETSLKSEFAMNERIDLSHDGHWMATANGSTMRFWQLSNQRMVQIFDTYGSPIVGLGWLGTQRLVAVASSDGVVRLWGTVSEGAAMGWKPVHVPLAMPEPGTQVPATSEQRKQVIDLRVFPRLPDSTLTTLSDSSLNYAAPVKIEEASLFQRHHLREAGWKEVPVPNAMQGMLQFEKDGFRVTASLYGEGDAKTNVSISHGVNYDLRWAPKLEGGSSEGSYEADQVVMYRSKRDLLDIELQLLKKFHAAGWTPYSRLNSSFRENEESRNLNFVRNGINLQISISRFPTDPSSYTIQYSKFPIPFSLPIPPDVSYVEFDGSTQPLLVAISNEPLTKVREFYDNAFAAQGWVPLRGRSESEQGIWLPYLREQQDIGIGLVKLKDGKTSIRVGEKLQNSSWQLAKEPEKTNLADGLEAADLPLPKTAVDTKYDSNSKIVESTVKGETLAALTDTFRKGMEPLGWKLDNSGVRSEEYTHLTFLRGKLEVQIRMRGEKGSAQINIQGDGLLWTKGAPGAKKRLSYETWLRTLRLPASLEWLPRYESEMKGLPQ